MTGAGAGRGCAYRIDLDGLDAAEFLRRLVGAGCALATGIDGAAAVGRHRITGRSDQEGAVFLDEEGLPMDDEDARFVLGVLLRPGERATVTCLAPGAAAPASRITYPS